MKSRNSERSLSAVALTLAALLLALPAARPSADSPQAETAKSADSFVDSVGVNVHIHYNDTPYGDFDSLRRVLKDLGVRHIRDGVIDTTWQPFYDRLNELGRLGIKADLVTSPKILDTLLAVYHTRVKDSIESYEAPNEYDQSHGSDPDWAKTLHDYVAKLNQMVKANRETASFPIIGPSMVRKESYAQVGDLAAYIDYANIHNYPGGRNPGTKGWTPQGYGSINYNLALANTAWPGKPVMTTETGYRTDEDNAQGVPEDITGKYFPRLLLEQYAHGIVRTYIYEMVDLGTKKKFGDHAFGLVRQDYTPKPAYSAVKNLLAVLSDPGPKFQPHSLAFQLSGDAATVHHLLFEKRDGRMYLVLWGEEQAYDVNKKLRASLSAHPVTVSFPGPVEVKSHALDDQGEMPSVALARGKTLSLTVGESVLVLEIKR